jgi:transposase
MRNASQTKSPKKGKRSVVKRQDWDLGLAVANPRAAGIDIGNEQHYVAVPPQLTEGDPVRCFGCFTSELNRLADWLVECKIQTVALQSTGVYWIPLEDILAQRGIKVSVVNARDTKNLPGRKTDVQECQWLLKLHTYGLLRDSFRPEEEVCKLRTYWRQRQAHIAEASRCIQRMQKTLTQMNIQLANAVSDISGDTGMAILRAMVAGERDTARLAKFRDPRIRATEEEIRASLEGNWRPELLFVLEQELSLYDTYQGKLGECDAAIAKHLGTLESKADPGELPPGKRIGGNAPVSFDLRGELYRISGVDLTRIDGISVLTAQTVVAEVGTDMSPWETEAHFASWLGLSPDNRQSGKKIKRGTRKVSNRVATALRQAASTLLRSKTYLGAKYRRLRTRLGAPKAVTAMAHSLSRLVFRMLKYGEAYVDRGMQYYEDKLRRQELQALERKAAEKGYKLILA